MPPWILSRDCGVLGKVSGNNRCAGAGSQTQGAVGSGWLHPPSWPVDRQAVPIPPKSQIIFFAKARRILLSGLTSSGPEMPVFSLPCPGGRRHPDPPPVDAASLALPVDAATLALPVDAPTLALPRWTLGRWGRGMSKRKLVGSCSLMALSLSEFRHGEPCHPQISILLPPPPVSKRPSGEGWGGG